MKKNKTYEALRILLNVSRIVSSSLDLKKVSKLVLKESMKALGSDHASVFVIDEASDHLMLVQARGLTRDQVDNIKVLGSWEAINEQLLKKKRPIIINDVKANRIFKRKRLPFSPHEKMLIQSFLAVPLQKDRKVVGALIVSNKKRPGHAFRKEDQRLISALSNHIAAAVQNARLYERLKSLFLSTVKSLVRAIEAKDAYTRGHSERVMKYGLAIGRQLKLKGEVLNNLGLSSLLHDVGKIGVREKVLYKPGKLSVRERDKISLHPQIGRDIVENIDGSDGIIRGIVEHHERYDGNGYPNRLKGNQISLEGRIIAIADTFDALTTNRPYQKKFTGKEAIFAILKDTSIYFDPKMVRAFIKSFSAEPDTWKT